MNTREAAIETRSRPVRRADQRAERSAAILAATVRILTREGIAAVTHRAVAREAHVPLAATTYYFDSKDEMIGAALATLVESEIEQLSRRAAEIGQILSTPAEFADALVDTLFGGEATPDLQLAKLEVCLEAARRPGLQTTAAEWRRAFTGLAETSLRLAQARDPERRAPLLVAAIDGVLVHELSEGVDAPDLDQRLRAQLEDVFELFLGAS